MRTWSLVEKNNLSAYTANDVDIKHVCHNNNMTFNIIIIIIRYYNIISKLIYVCIL